MFLVSSFLIFPGATVRSINPVLIMTSKLLPFRCLTPNPDDRPDIVEVRKIYYCPLL